MTLLLGDAERIRFIEYLEMEVRTTEDLIEQMRKVKTPEFLIRKFTAEVVAMRIVVIRLRSFEATTIIGTTGTAGTAGTEEKDG